MLKGSSIKMIEYFLVMFSTVVGILLGLILAHGISNYLYGRKLKEESRQYWKELRNTPRFVEDKWYDWNVKNIPEQAWASTEFNEERGVKVYKRVYYPPSDEKKSSPVNRDAWTIDRKFP